MYRLYMYLFYLDLFILPQGESVVKNVAYWYNYNFAAPQKGMGQELWFVGFGFVFFFAGSYSVVI